jgi:hypothetical protein
MTTPNLSPLVLGLSLSLIPPGAWAQSFERNVDRPGSDYRNFNIDGSPAACQAACGRDDECRAWTYVRAGYQGPLPRCWLKFRIPSPTGNQCCISGVMR